jgi:hypothetical protein
MDMRPINIVKGQGLCKLEAKSTKDKIDEQLYED